MRYGVCYMGSKNAIAREMVRELPAADTFVDLFSGGCAVTHAAILSGKWRRFIVNDVNPIGQRVFIDSIAGKNNGRWREWVSHEDFDLRKDADPVIALCWSFGNNPLKGYLYGRGIEPVKRAVHRFRVFGDRSLIDGLRVADAGAVTLQSMRQCEALTPLARHSSARGSS